MNPAVNFFTYLVLLTFGIRQHEVQQAFRVRDNESDPIGNRGRPRGGAGIYACDIDSVELALATEVAIRYPQSPCRRRLTPLSSHRSRSLCDGAVERSRECYLGPYRFREFARNKTSHVIPTTVSERAFSSAREQEGGTLRLTFSGLAGEGVGRA